MKKTCIESTGKAKRRILRAALLIALLLLASLFGCTAPRSDEGSASPAPVSSASPSPTDSVSPAAETPAPAQPPVFDFETRTVTLNSGHEMPIIGLGTWTMTNEQADECVYHALQCGVRLIDTARYYQCEQGVGLALARAIESGIVKREEVFITTKIMPSDFDRADEAIDESLADLACGYIDLMLIHQPGRNDEAVYRAMESAVRDGKIRSIGISNYYTVDSLNKILEFAEIPPAVIQIENHIFTQNRELKEYAESLGIVINSYYPFGGRGNTQKLFENEVIASLAEKYGKTPAQVILRWHLQAGYIAIPGSKNPDHIRENYDVFGFELSQSDMAQILALDEQKRFAGW